MLTEVGAVPDAALPVAALHGHLRLASGFAGEGVPEEEALLRFYLRAALAAIEGRIGKALLEREFRWEVGFWRDGGAGGQALPLAPVAEILSLALRSRDGAEVAVDPARYRLAADAHRPRLVPVGRFLPSLPVGGQAVVVLRAGFGGWDDLPADLAQAVLLLAARYYEHRHEAGAEAAGAVMPFGVAALIERWRTVRVLGGGAR